MSEAPYLLFAFDASIPGSALMFVPAATEALFDAVVVLNSHAPLPVALESDVGR